MNGWFLLNRLGLEEEWILGERERVNKIRNRIMIRI